MTDSYWSKFHRRRMTRRSLIAAVGATSIGLAGLAITGCGDDDDDDSADDSTPDATSEEESPEETAGEDESPEETETEEAEEPSDIPTGGTFRVSTDVGFDSLDPHATVAAGLVVIPRVYNRLLTRAPAISENINYDLATAVELPDDVTYIFSLRDDVVIGANSFDVPERALNIDDIIASLDRNKADPVLNGYNFVAVDTASYGAAGPNEFQAVSSKVNGFYLDGYGFFHFPPVELLERGNLKQEAVGGGGYLVDSFTEGQGVQLVRNPTYYNQPLPYLDGLSLTIIPDRAARRTAFVDNQSDLYVAENKDEADQLLGQVDGIVNIRELSTATTNISLQVRQGPFMDERVRLAVLHGIDRSQFISILEGEGGGEPDGLVWSAFGRYTLPADELEELQGFDPDMSRELLEAAGLGDGLTVKLIYPTTSTQDFAPILIQQMAAIGIELEQEPLDFATWLGRYQSGDFEMLLSPNISYPGPISHLAFHQDMGPSENGNFWTGFSDSESTAAIEAIESELTVEGQQQLFLEAQRLIYSRAPAYIPIFSAYNNNLLYEYVKNYRIGELPPILYLTEFDQYIDR